MKAEGASVTSMVQVTMSSSARALGPERTQPAGLAQVMKTLFLHCCSCESRNPEAIRHCPASEGAQGFPSGAARENMAGSILTLQLFFI